MIGCVPEMRPPREIFTARVSVYNGLDCFATEGRQFPMIEIKGLKVRFGEQEVLRGIDWFIPPKSRVGLVGGNGAGKTTLLRVLAGEADYEGSISMPKGHAVGYLPQDLVEVKDEVLLDYLRERAGLTDIAARLADCEERMSAASGDAGEAAACGARQAPARV